MLEITLISIAVLILLVAGILIAREHKKDTISEKRVKSKEDSSKDITFDSKYEEITYLYKSGAINEKEYKDQIKNYIN